MKLNSIDTGGSHPWPEPKSGQTAGIVFVEGAGGQNYARGNSRLPHAFPFWVRPTAPVGGAAAGSAQALKYLLQQIHQLVKNPDLQPVYLQPLATDEVGAYSAASEFDGWYWLDSFEAPHRNNVNSGIVKATLQATPAGPATVRRVGQSFVGGALASGYSGTAMPWVAFPVNSTPAVSSTTRSGSDGAIPIWLNPALNPAPFVMPPTIADMFKGGCHIYDTVIAGGNPVPTGAGTGPNLLSNGGFETTTGPTAWVLGGAGTGLSTVSAANPHSGANNLQATNPSAGNYGTGFEPVGIPVSGLATLNVSAWIKGTAGGTTGPLRVTFANPGTNVSVAGVASAQPSAQAGISAVDFNPTITNAYAQYQENVAVPAGYQFAFIEFYSNGNGATGTVFVDDIAVTNAAANSNWLEVFGPEHVFTGDIVALNGLSLLRFQTGVNATIATVWLWSAQLGTPAWQQWATLQYQDNADNSGVLRQVSLDHVGLDEVQLKAVGWTSAGNEAVDLIRLQRGAYGPRIEFRPQSQANTSTSGLRLQLVVGAKIIFNSAIVQDVAIGGGSLSITTDYGYAAAIITGATPYLCGLFWQNPATSQPAVGSSALVGVGDNSGPGQNIGRQYGLFALPFPTPQNLQAEAESGVLGIGWSSQVDAGASAGNTARGVGGTGAGNAALFGTAWTAGAAGGSPLYDVWFRVKVTSAAGAAAEMKLGIWYVGGASFVASTTFRANQAGTSYVWLRAVAGWNPNSFTNTYQFRAETAATLGTDWFVDEAVMVPISGQSSFGLPQDLWRQFMSDRRIELSLA